MQCNPNRDLLALGRRQHRVRPVPRNAGRRGSGTAANEAAGAQKRFAGLFAAGILLVAVLLLLGWIERIPQPVLAAIAVSLAMLLLKSLASPRLSVLGGSVRMITSASSALRTL
jgi:hypothetical protein